MIELGQKVRFLPSWVHSYNYTPEEKNAASVTGKVVFVNKGHKMFVAEYGFLGTKQRESFKFCQIGKDVTVVG